MRLHRAAQRASCAVLRLPRPPSAEIGVLQAANNKLRFQDEQMKARRSVTVPFTFRGHSGHGSRYNITGFDVTRICAVARQALQRPAMRSHGKQ